MDEERSQADAYEQWIAWVSSKVHDSRAPMQDVYGSVFSSLVSTGMHVEDARRKSIEFVEKTFSVKGFVPMSIPDFLDNLF